MMLYIVDRHTDDKIIQTCMGKIPIHYRETVTPWEEGKGQRWAVMGVLDISVTILPKLYGKWLFWKQWQEPDFWDSALLWGPLRAPRLLAPVVESGEGSIFLLSLLINTGILCLGVEESIYLTSTYFRL